MDQAIGGHYSVQDLRLTKKAGTAGPDFHVRGYDSIGNLLLSTWHIGEHSMQMECDAWERRGAVKVPFDPIKEL